MEIEMGYVKVILNLGRLEDGFYFEIINYVVVELYESGLIFKLVDLMVILEDKVVDISKVYDSYGG